MAYETRLYIGTVRKPLDAFGNKKRAVIIHDFTEIATIDLCSVAYERMGFIIEQCRNIKKLAAEKKKLFKHVQGYFVSEDKSIAVDKYEDALIGIPANVVLEAMQADNAAKPYRRFPPAIALLSSILENFEHNEIYCVLYGY